MLEDLFHSRISNAHENILANGKGITIHEALYNSLVCANDKSNVTQRH